MNVVIIKEAGKFNAMQAEPRLRSISCDAGTEAEAVAALLEYHAELVRSGQISLDELVSTAEVK